MPSPVLTVLRHPLTAALALYFAAAQPVLAADGHEIVRPIVKRDEAKLAPLLPRTGSAAAPAPTADPMDVLRERLAQRLGAAKAPDAKTPYVMQVSSKAEAPDAHAAPAAAVAAPPKPRKAAAAAAPGTADLVATLRAEKAAAGHRPDGHSLHWSYDGAAGPEAWARVNPEFAKCSTGQRQSPIDIRGGVRVDLDPIQFDYRPAGFRVIDNGHTVQVNVGGGNSIEAQGRRYDLVQFHFHRPSEERIDGRQFDMVAHLVHKDAEGRLAVVAVLLDRGSAHPVVQQVWNNLPLEKGEELPAKATIDLGRLLPEDKRYYTYMGSLTTPPCSEGVLWMVMQQPVAISPDQVNVFARLYPMNARPIQSAAGRLIKQSN
ncbi:carbonic anhydrase [Aquabacterium sp.]|uniref:carbonic anhydrase n=1 Tax=Aquabacterium sp. TaxID=1872578 RepID=UPI002B9CF5B0|nr:carbonic anhydrase family protein [Aquabacterium sp.]HSW07485.1 carbonic anhydrase family protein [Aquabacterium sp.]